MKQVTSKKEWLNNNFFASDKMFVIQDKSITKCGTNKPLSGFCKGSSSLAMEILFLILQHNLMLSECVS